MKRFFFPLFHKFTVAIIIIVAVFGSVNIYMIWSKVYRSLENEMGKRGLYIARSLASQSVDPLLYGDYISIQQSIENIKLIDSTISYLFILNPHNQVLVHTFEDGFPQQLIDANNLPNNASESIQRIRARGDVPPLIRDIAVPIMNGKLGVVRVGISETGIRQDVIATVKRLLLMVAIFSLIGIAGAFIFARFINHPVQAIIRIADQLDFKALKSDVRPRIHIREKLFGRFALPFRAHDELDELANRFNDMIVRLENAYGELQKAQDKLIESEKLASVGTLSAGIAHEINNPIAGLQSCIRRISRDPGNIAQNRKYLQMMAEAIDKVERVVQGLLDFSRQHKFYFATVSCADIVEKALLLAAYRLEKRRISVSKNIPSTLPKIPASANHLEQVLLNLLLNSIDAIEENCAKQPHNCERRIFICARNATGEFIQLSIEDTGGGIPAELRGKIFDPFFTTKSVGKGTGLGLSVCYNIMKAHHGSIDIYSEPGQGTTVTLLLPKKNHEEKSENASP